MKKEIVKEQKDVNKIRKEWESHYNDYFYQTFYQSFNVDGIDFQQEDFLKLKLFYEGSIACFNIKWTETNEFNPNGIACFTSFAGVQYNIYNFPIYAMLINNRGVPFIPNTPQEVNKDCVVGWILPTRKSLYYLIQPIVRSIVNAEMLINTNTNILKIPFFVAVSPEDRERMQKIVNDILSDKIVVYGDFNELNLIKTIINNTPYMLDKLIAYRDKRINDCLTILGINNSGLTEKKEHLITSELEVNNEIIQSSRDVYMNMIIKFFENVNKVLNHQFKVVDNLKERGVEDEKIIQD